jgi:hypothetical protein
MRRFTASLLLWAAVPLAAGAEFSGPVLGFVYDETSKSIRPLLGTPGAAVIGAAADDHRYDKAVVSGDKGVGVGFVADASGVVRVAPQEAPTVVPDGLSRFDVAALSAGGSSAALYSKECACVQVMTDLGSTARVIRTVALTDGDNVRTLAVNDDGSLLAIALTTSRVLIHAGEQVREIKADGAALAFNSDGRRLAVADDVRKIVVLYANVADAPEVVHIVSERDGLNSPKALWFGSAGKLLVADGGGMVHAVELDAPMRTVSCACVPDTFARTAAAEVLRITGVGSGTAWVVKAVEDRLETLFIPIVRETEVGQ